MTLSLSSLPHAPTNAKFLSVFRFLCINFIHVFFYFSFFDSGTLSYIFNNFMGTKAFSQVVKEAKEAGYTEPDPRDDLAGTDVARKVLADKFRSLL